jgi:hypothetical protein
MPKLRTTFFEEGEDDEPMDHQIITATFSENKLDPICISKGGVLENCRIQFGSFAKVVTQEKNIIEVRSTTQAIPDKVSIGANINKEEMNRQRKPYVKIGSMLVMLEESKDGIDIIHGLPRLWSTFHSSYMWPHLYPITRYGNLKSIQTWFGSTKSTQSKIFLRC